jgi:hypothetical protein
VAGLVVDEFGANASFLVAIIPAAVAAAVVAACQRLLVVPAQNPEAAAVMAG